MTIDINLLAALFTIALSGLQTVVPQLLQEDIEEALLGGTGAVSDGDPVGHDT